ncbi:MAG TPA: ComEC/Rec2 family competence protein [Candidatus Saccharimonadales bacterium]
MYLQRSHIVTAGLVGIVGGIYLAKYGYHTNYGLVLIGFASLPLIARMKMAALIPALIVGLNIGLWRGGQAYANLRQYDKFKDQKVTLQAKVENDAAYSDRGQLEFIVSDIRHVGSGLNLPGTVRIRGFNAPSVRRADIVEVSGKLREGFGSRQGFMSYADVQVVSRDGSWLESARAEYFAGVYNALPEPQASLGLGFLVGTRTLLPESLTTALMVTGLTHIVAVSGYNLTILVRLTRRLFAGKSLYLATASSLALIAGFVMVTGFSPSIVRATVVSVLAITAWYYGRSIKPAVLLLAAAAITSLMNPYYIWSDLGWYLSFAAFAGILILAPLLSRRLFKHKPKILGQIILETSCAQLLTLPIIMFSFSQVSLISLLANVIVLPLIPLAMLTTFLAGLAGMFIPALAGWLAWPAQIILTFMVDIINILAKVPWALKEMATSSQQMLMIYLAIFALILGLRRHHAQALNAAEVIE